MQRRLLGALQVKANAIPDAWWRAADLVSMSNNRRSATSISSSLRRAANGLRGRGSVEIRYSAQDYSFGQMLLRCPLSPEDFLEALAAHQRYADARLRGNYSTLGTTASLDVQERAFLDMYERKYGKDWDIVDWHELEAAGLHDHPWVDEWSFSNLRPPERFLPIEFDDPYADPWRRFAGTEDDSPF